MAKIHVNRNRESLGQFTPEEVSAGLREGRFFAADLGWTEGMESWKPLGEFTDLPDPGEMPVAAPPVPFEPEFAPGEVVSAEVPITPAWEGDPEGSWVSRSVATIKSVLMEPGQAFAGTRADGGLLKPLTFAIFVGFLANLIATVYSWIYESINPNQPGSTSEMFGSAVVFVYVGLIVLLPLLIAVGLFINAGLIQLALLILGEGDKPFGKTFRVAAYASGASSVLLIIPLCGPIVQAVWGIIIQIIGLQSAHKLPLAKAIIAALLPVLLGCGIAIAVVSLLIGASTAAAGAGAGFIR